MGIPRRVSSSTQWMALLLLLNNTPVQADSSALDFGKIISGSPRSISTARINIDCCSGYSVGKFTVKLYLCKNTDISTVCVMSLTNSDSHTIDLKREAQGTLWSVKLADSSHVEHSLTDSYFLSNAGDPIPGVILTKNDMAYFAVEFELGKHPAIEGMLFFYPQVSLKTGKITHEN